MARSTTRSLAGKAAQAARKVVAKRASGAASSTAARGAANGVKMSAKKAPAKKAPATSKAPAKRAAAKKAPATGKVAAKKAPATGKAPAKKAAAKKAPATGKVAAKKVPAKKAPATKQAAATRAPATKVPPKAPAKTPAKAPQKAPARKAATKKAATPGSLAILPGDKPWTKAEVDEVIADLKSDRARAVRTLTAQEEELAGLMRDAGDGAGHDQADMGATSFERDQELTVLNNEREKLAQIDRALARIADGTYGTCESCGNPIGKGRAMAFPRATLCLTCKQREERR